MPVYNGEESIAESLNSLLAQTYTDFELIISDNASTDGTESICRSYADKDKRVIYKRNKKNIGIAKNYNVLVDYARGKYFKWASANDVCKPTMLEKCVKVLEERKDVVLCYPETVLFGEDKNMVEKYTDNMDLQDTKPSQRFKKYIDRVKLNNVMNGLIRLDVLKKTPLNKEHFSTDLNFTAELTLYGKFVEVHEPLFYRRMDDQTLTSLKSEEEATRCFHPELDKAMLFQYWKLFFEYYSSVWRAPITRIEKFNIYKYLLKRTIWARVKLYHDLVDAMKVHLSGKK